MAEIRNLTESWEGHTGEEVESLIKGKLQQQVNGITVNGTAAQKDLNGNVTLTIPEVDASLNASSANPVQNSAVAGEINAVKSQPFGRVETTPKENDPSQLTMQFYDTAGSETPFASVDIPAPQEIGEIIAPKVTTELLSSAIVKLGDTIRMRWTYDCIRTADGASESVAIPALTVTVTVKAGQTTLYSETRSQVAAGTAETLTIGPDIITSAGTVSITVVATASIDEETKTSRGSKSVTVVSMNLATTFDPASQLALSNGFTDGQTVSVPYNYTVPAGTTLYIWIDGVLHSTSNIGGTGRQYLYLTASELTSGRHNIQMIASYSGLLSDAVMVDLLKAGGTNAYLGIRQVIGVPAFSSMPLAYDGTIALNAEQFGDLSIDYAAWNSESLTSAVRVQIDGVTTQSLTADRNLQTLTQGFDESGQNTLAIAIMSGDDVLVSRTYSVAVAAAEGISETEAVGYRVKLTAKGRSNSEESNVRSDWGGITTIEGVDWRTNGWNRGSDGIDALLLTNGATATIDIKPFVLDASDGDYSIQSRGMTLEMEVMVSQVMERGATVLSCLCDNGGNGYPMGVKITTEEAGLYFGGVEEITTAEDLVDAEGNYIDYDGNIVDEANKVKLKISRPHGVSMNIAVDRWVHLTFVVQPVTSGYGLGMLFINGVLSRANRYTGSLRQNTPAGITIDSDKADVRIRSLRYYRTPLGADEVLGNWIIDRPTAAQIQAAHTNNAVGDSNNTTDTDGNIAIDHDTLLSRGRGILTIIRSDDSGYGLSDLFTCTDKKQNFPADLVRWEPPLDSNGNPIGEGFEARNVRVRIQGTSSVKYPYKNFRIYLTTQQGSAARSLVIGGVDVTATAGGYAMRGSGNSIEQAVICAKTDFVDSSLVMNTGGAHLFNDIMHALNLDTPPQAYDARVRQAIDGLPCDIYAGTNENGTLRYCGQFVLNNEKSKSAKIFGMEGVKDSSDDDVDFRAYSGGNPVIDTKPFALEALTNSSPMTLFQSAGSADSTELANQLAAEFDNGFEFNHPEDAKWATIGTGSYSDWSGAQTAVKRLFGWIYDCVPSLMRANPDYGTQQGWSDASKTKWVSGKFKSEASQYFNVNHLLTYYLFTDYWASVDQRAKNILWRTWDGLIWWATFYDGDTAMSIRNDAFMVYLYDVTRDTYDTERSKYAFEGHNSWLWCLVLANFEDELKECAANLRNQLTTQVMLREFNEIMQGNWSERQYNKSGKLKYIDTIGTMNYVYTLTGNRELHRTQFLTDRARLLDARYGAGNYNGDVITFTVVRNASDTPSHLTLKSGDLYYFGYKLNGIWLQGPSRAAAGESLTLDFTDTLATNDPLMLAGASCIIELDLTEMGSQLNGTVGLSLCTMLSKLVMPATNGVANAPLTLGDTAKLEYVDITGQTAVNTGTTGIFDLSKHTRLTTLLAGGTSLTDIKLPEGSPLETLVMPSTLQTLTLRYLPKLTENGLTLQGTQNVTELNFAECPYLDWRSLVTRCPNLRYIRVEGITGRVRSSLLDYFMEAYDNGTLNGLNANGGIQTYPALIGTVQLIDVVDDITTYQNFFSRCGLEVTECQYSEYVFHDEETDPANITNEDNQTGYAYGNAYVATGHIVKVRKRCWPVGGIINAAGKMVLRKLISTNNGDESLSFTPLANTEAGTKEDAFLYVPRYYYKGVNDYLHATKHFFLSSRTVVPDSTGTRLIRKNLSDEDVIMGQTKVFPTTLAVGDVLTNEALVDTSLSVNVYRVSVEGQRQVRYPGYLSSLMNTSAFTDLEGRVLELHQFTMQDIAGDVNSPADFDNTIGDYLFREIPDGATHLWFICNSGIPAETKVAITTNSTELESIEPDWVEHKPELIGLYQGHVDGWANTYGSTAPARGQGQSANGTSGGLRSMSDVMTSRGNGTATTNSGWQYDDDGNPSNLPATAYNGTAQDFLNFARWRNIDNTVGLDLGDSYSSVPYETSKDMANLMMAWSGTRDIESNVGLGCLSAYITGRQNAAGAETAYSQATNSNPSWSATNVNNARPNKIWWLEGWTGSMNEWMDKVCLNAPSFSEFVRANRPASAAYTTDYYYNIVQQDGNERRVKAATGNQASNVARVRFGRFCDIVASAYAGDTIYASSYSAYQSSSPDKGRVVGRSGGSASAAARVAYSNTNNASSNSYTSHGGRLCFFGEIENESVLTE